MSPDAVEVVVARYREDVSWTAALGLPVTIYDKSGQPGPLALPNIGREAHTYLTHILRRYDSLAAYTVFVQGAPFEHMEPGATPASFAARIAQNVRLGVQFTGFAAFKLKCDRLGRPHDLADPAKHGHRAGFGKDRSKICRRKWRTKRRSALALRLEVASSGRQRSPTS